MGQWSFLTSRRWLGYLALLVVFCVVCVLLGLWQLDRRATILVENDRIINNWDSAPMPLAELEPDPEYFDLSHTWQRVTLQGEYLVEEQVLARVRPFQGRPGFEILTPFLSNDGQVLVVNRGWLRTGFAQDYPDEVPAPPLGEVQLTVRLKPTEPLLTRQAPDGQVASIYVPGLLEQIGLPGYQQLYGSMVSESPTADTGVIFPRPKLTEGPHLSYSLQWFVFAIMAIFGYGYLAWKHFRDFHPDDVRSRQWKTRKRQRHAKKYRDEDFEDAIVDQMHAG